jgi:hypothetical protein
LPLPEINEVLGGYLVVREPTTTALTFARRYEIR